MNKFVMGFISIVFASVILFDANPSLYNDQPAILYVSSVILIVMWSLLVGYGDAFSRLNILQLVLLIWMNVHYAHLTLESTFGTLVSVLIGITVFVVSLAILVVCEIKKSKQG